MKCLEERLEEAMNIRIQLRNTGIEMHHSTELQPLFKIIENYVRHGTSASGSMRIDANSFSKIEYNFTPTLNVVSHCRIVR